MPPITGALTVPEMTKLLKDLREFQREFYSSASNYTKIILGLGYGAFFAAWSGTHNYLTPHLRIWSALLIAVSLILYLAYEISGTLITSYLAVKFARATDVDPAILPAALASYRSESARLTKPLIAAWFAVFPACVVTGLSGAFVLIAAFVRALLR